MTCIVCHRSVGTRAKKCPCCGAPSAISKGDFLFEMNSADEKQLKKYYEQSQETKNGTDNATNNKSVASSNISPAYRQTPSPASTQQGISQREGGFLENHGLTLLKYIGYASFIGTLIIMAARIKISAMLLVILAGVLVFSAYLIYSQICHTTKRSVVFWSCTVISIIIAVTSYIFGKNATEWANSTMMAWVDYAKSSQLDVVQQLLVNYTSTFTTAMAMTFSIPAWLNIPLVNFELKNNKKSIVFMVIGILFFFLAVCSFGITLGNYTLLKNEIINYCSTAFPDIMLVF